MGTARRLASSPPVTIHAARCRSASSAKSPPVTIRRAWPSDGRALFGDGGDALPGGIVGEDGAREVGPVAVAVAVGAARRSIRAGEVGAVAPGRRWARSGSARIGAPGARCQHGGIIAVDGAALASMDGARLHPVGARLAPG